MGDKLGVGKLFYALVVIGAITLISMTIDPNLNTMLHAVSTTGWRDITILAYTLLPYTFWGFIVLMVLGIWKFGAPK